MFALLATLIHMIPNFDQFRSLEECLRYFVVRGINPITNNVGEFSDTPFPLGEEVPFTYATLSLMELGEGIGIFHGNSLVINGGFDLSPLFGVSVLVTEAEVTISWQRQRAVLKHNGIAALQLSNGRWDMSPRPYNGDVAILGMPHRGEPCWTIKVEEGRVVEYAEGTLEPNEFDGYTPTPKKWHRYPG